MSETTPLTPRRLAEIRERLAQTRDVAALADWPLEDYQAVKQQLHDSADLLAEVERLRTTLRSACDDIAAQDDEIGAQSARAAAAEGRVRELERDRAAVLNEAADRIQAKADALGGDWVSVKAVCKALRRMGDAPEGGAR